MDKELITSNIIDTETAYKQAVLEMRNPPPSVRLPWWNLFNEYTGGFRAREFSIFCGSTGSGKTAFTSCVSAQLLSMNIKHFVMSVETGYADFMKRVMGALTQKELNDGDVVPIQTVAEVTAKLAPLVIKNSIQLSIYENRVPTETLVFELEHMAKEGCKIAIIDNLNFFMEPTSAQNQNLEMDRVIHELIILCKRIDMHVIMIMHPRKPDSGGTTRIENEYGIKGSSTAVQEAQNVFLFNRPHPDDIQNGNSKFTYRELKIAKMRRRGKYVGKTIVFNFNQERYEEIGSYDQNASR